MQRTILYKMSPKCINSNIFYLTTILAEYAQEKTNQAKKIHYKNAKKVNV